MEISDFLETINAHTKSIYVNEIVQVAESGQITNWLLGLAGGALIFGFNKYSSIEDKDLPIVTIQAILFTAIVAVGYLHRLKTKAFRDHTTYLIRMFDFLKIEFDLIPNEIVEELKDEKLNVIFDNYLNGEYIAEDLKEEFAQISADQGQSYIATKVLTTTAIVLLVLEFGCYFALIL